MIIDCHVHLGESLYGHKLNTEELLDSMDRLGIDRVVVMPFKPFDYHFEPENDKIAQTVQRHPDRFIGFGRIDPWRKGKAVKEIKRIFEVLNLSGLFIHPWEENCPVTSPRMREALEAARIYKKPVMISGGHVRVSHAKQLQFIAGKFSDITFIFTSGGQINICGSAMSDAEEMLKACRNVIMETSGIYRRDFIEQMTEKIGPDRVIFGSGAPYYDQEFELERIKTAKMSDDARNRLQSGCPWMVGTVKK